MDIFNRQDTCLKRNQQGTWHGWLLPLAFVWIFKFSETNEDSNCGNFQQSNMPFSILPLAFNRYFEPTKASKIFTAQNLALSVSLASSAMKHCIACARASEHEINGRDVSFQYQQTGFLLATQLGFKFQFSLHFTAHGWPSVLLKSSHYTKEIDSPAPLRR